MRQGIVVVNFGDYADPRRIVEIAVHAEAAGWDGLFVWDHLGWVIGIPSGDPFVALAGAAARTERIRLGTQVTAVARHRPHVLAHHLANLDLLSGGRLILGVGLGAVDTEFSAFGEPDSLRTRADMTDEALDVMTQLWAGHRVDHDGAFYQARDVTMAPLPVQRPRVPIWIGGTSPAAMRRAAAWDGWFAASGSQDGRNEVTPDELAARVAGIRAVAGTRGEPFDIVVDGYSTPNDGSLLSAYAQAGATWWLEQIHGFRGTREELMARIGAGPTL